MHKRNGGAATLKNNLASGKWKEETCVASAIVKSASQYKNKWAAGIFEDWQRA